MFTSMFKVVCGLIGLYEVQSVYVYDSMPMNFGYLGKLNITKNYDYHSTDGLGNTCCLSCSVGKMKYYKLMNNKRQCEEVCLTKNEYTFYRYYDKELRQDIKSTLPCEYRNYHVYNSTDDYGICPGKLCSEGDIYNKDYIK